ncbi:hypothetical protein [Streptomyces zhihengii]
MSTDSFHLAPDQSTQAGATTLPAPAPATVQTPAPRKAKTTQPVEPQPTLAGAIVPGAVLTGLISLCWLIHHFGLAAVIIAVMACAAAATAALAVKARKGTRRLRNARKDAARNRGSGGGSGARTVLNSGGGGRMPRPSKGRGTGGGKGAAGLGSLKAPKRSTGTGASRGPGSTGTGAGGGRRQPLSLGGRTGAGTTGKGAGTAGRGSLGDQKNVPGSRKHDRTQGPVNRGGIGGLFGNRSGQTSAGGGKNQAQKQQSNRKTPKTLKPTVPGPGNSGAAAGGKQRKHGKGSTGTGKSGLLSRISRRKNQASAAPHKPASAIGAGHNLKTTPKPRPTSKSMLGKLTKAARKNTAGGGTLRTPKPKHLKPKTLQPARKTKKAGGKGKTPKLKHTRNMTRMRRASYLAGVKLRKHTSKKTRLRIRKVVSPARRTARAANRVLSPALAHALRWGSRSFLGFYTGLGTVRYTSSGPNWVRPLAKVLHVIYRPAALLVAASGTWGWLNRWMYTHTSGPSAADRINTPKQNPQQVDPLDQPTDQHGDWAGLPGTPFTPPTDHDTVTSPATTGALVSEYAAPLEQAAEAVQQAGAMLLTNPAENMVGYEATIRALATLQAAIGTVVAQAGETTRENFAVNPAVAEAYDDTAGYAHNLAARLEEIPTLYRSLHADQVENIENPTPQGRKWDIAANE